MAFWWSMPEKLPRNSREIGQIFREFVPKNPAKFDFFFRFLKPWIAVVGVVAVVGAGDVVILSLV